MEARTDEVATVDDEKPSRIINFRDLYLGIGVIVIGLLTIAGVTFLAPRPLEFWTDTTPGASFLPIVVASIVILCGIWAIVRQRLPIEVTSSELVAAAKFLALLIAAAALFTLLGGLLTIGLFVFAELKLLHKRTWLFAALGGIGAALGVWLIFVLALQVRLPLGFFTYLQ